MKHSKQLGRIFGVSPMLENILYDPFIKALCGNHLKYQMMLRAPNVEYNCFAVQRLYSVLTAKTSPRRDILSAEVVCVFDCVSEYVSVYVCVRSACVTFLV